MITIENIKGLPYEYESFLIEKYESYVATCRYVEVFYADLDINHMLVYDDDKLTDLLIFGNSGKTSTCFNLFTEFDQQLLEKCIKKQFDEYPAIEKIEVGASYKEYNLPKSLLWDRTTDYIVDLPTTMDGYFSNLGASTRKNARKLKKKLLNDFQVVNFEIRFGSDIDKSIIERIIRLNEARMKEKGIVYKAHFELDDIFRFSQLYGVLVYLEVNGEIIGGTISCIINKGIFGLIVAHDSRFSKYSIGLQIQFYEIEACIDRGITSLHFLWGDNDYKKRLLGKPHELFSYLIYSKYSLEFILKKYQACIHMAYIRFKHSEFSKPIRNAFKMYRRKS